MVRATDQVCLAEDDAAGCACRRAKLRPAAARPLLPSLRAAEQRHAPSRLRSGEALPHALPAERRCAKLPHQGKSTATALDNWALASSFNSACFV
eukprot:scaffold129674_cov66-Phaeocystis_antarctica.AAC.11